MRGSIWKRCGCPEKEWARCPHSWRISVSAGFNEAGKRRRPYRTVRGARRDAERAVTALLAEVDRGTLTDARNMTLQAYLTDEWLPAVSRVSKRGRPLAPTTKAKYQDASARVVAVIGRVRLGQLRPAHVERLRDELLASLSPQTVGDVLRVLAGALRRAVAKGLIARNPADPSIVDRPAGKPKPLPVIGPELASRILEAVRGTDPWDVAAHLALGCTMRREEVLGLQWSAVDLDAGCLDVTRTATWAEGALHVGPPKSEAGERTLELPGFVVEALRRHRAAQAERRLLAGEAWTDLGLVVDRGDGSPWPPPSFSKGWERFASKAGFRGVTFHALRHGAATLLLAGGVPDAVAIEIMGHADTRILRRYQEVVPQLKREAAGRLEALLGAERS
jgi:integrase